MPERFDARARHGAAVTVKLWMAEVRAGLGSAGLMPISTISWSAWGARSAEGRRAETA